MARIVGLLGLGAVAGASTPLQAIEFTKYPGYMGDLNVTGTVSIGLVNSDSVYLYANLAGTDPICDNATFEWTGNQCGFHIHEGETCDTAGGHHWNKASSANDPWVPVRLVDGKLTQKIVNVGLAADNLTRTLVVHDHTNARIACAVITAVVAPSATLTVGTFGAYPGYTGTLTDVSGDVTIGHVAPDVQFVTFSLSNLDPMCTPDFTPGTQPGYQNACGIHIHVGADCSDASKVGGHHFNMDVVTADPWGDIKYVIPVVDLAMKDSSASMKQMKPLFLQSSAANTSANGISYAFQTGLQEDSLYSRAFVVHDSLGGRIACGVLPKKDGGGDGGDNGAFSFVLGLPILTVLFAMHA